MTSRPNQAQTDSQASSERLPNWILDSKDLQILKTGYAQADKVLGDQGSSAAVLHGKYKETDVAVKIIKGTPPSNMLVLQLRSHW